MTLRQAIDGVVSIDSDKAIPRGLMEITERPAVEHHGHKLAATLLAVTPRKPQLRLPTHLHVIDGELADLEALLEPL
jgi:hypothetical protein